MDVNGFTGQNGKSSDITVVVRAGATSEVNVDGRAPITIKSEQPHASGAGDVNGAFGTIKKGKSSRQQVGHSLACICDVLVSDSFNYLNETQSQDIYTMQGLLSPFNTSGKSSNRGKGRKTKHRIDSYGGSNNSIASMSSTSSSMSSTGKSKYFGNSGKMMNLPSIGKVPEFRKKRNKAPDQVRCKFIFRSSYW